MGNPICTRKKEHWTFHGSRGKSCPDHILIPAQLANAQNNYWVYQKLACGSDHRLVQAKIVFEKLKDTFWGHHTTRKCNWTEEKTTVQYKEKLDQESTFINEAKYMLLPRNKATVIKLADEMIGALQNAFETVSEVIAKNEVIDQNIYSEKPNKHTLET
jgi:hypothetical protein